MNIYDIAKKAQVSIATVSRVINNSPKVSEKTKQKVLATMEREGYVPNAFARGLGLNSMRMIGVLCTDITDPFYANAVGSIERLLKKQHKDIVLKCTGNNLSDKKSSLSYMVGRRVDAIVLIGSAFKEESDNSHIRSAAQRLPIIIINGYIDLPNVYCVVCDERGAVRQNVKNLYAAGCKKILYLYDTATYSGNEKLSGFVEGCLECGINKENQLAFRVERSVSSVCDKISELIALNTEFDAVMASEDLLAAAALNALRKTGITLPVIGFNNSIIAECTNPPLTSVDNMIEVMCETAVRMLDDIAKHKSVPGKTVISAKLIERETFKKEI
ncbi:MAG: LacI family DNA-binding transcriptional regulator [Acutalibacteraceae bacterium]